MRPITFQEVITPMVCFMICFIIFLIGGLTYVKYKRKVFRSSTLLILISTIYLLSKSLYIGFLLAEVNILTALKLNRIMELIPVLFLPFLPYFLTDSIHLNNELKKINQGFLWTGAALAALIFLSAFIVPDSFLSITHASFPVKEQINAGRGVAGIFYDLRDLTLMVYILWAGFVLIFSRVKKMEQINSIETLLGLSIAMVLSLFDLYQSSTGEFLIWKKLYLNRFDLAVTIFSCLVFWSVMKYFMNYVQKNEELAKILDEKKDQLYEQASFDPKTSLYNQRIFRKQIQNIVESQEQAGILLLDLEGFHDLNEAYGTDLGDEILIAVADRMQKNARPMDICYRIGNDEFALIVQDLSGKDFLRRYVEVLHALLTQPYEILEQEYYVNISIGVLTLPEEADTISNAISNLFSALRIAKKKGNSVIFFNPSLRKIQERKVVVAHQLRESLKKEEFYLLYQPIVNQNRDIVALESLVRCQSDFFPGEFIPMAERAGMMQELGFHILNLVIRDLIKYPDLPFRVFVNLSAEQFKEDDFGAILVSRLKASGIGSDKVGFEIPEEFMQKFEEKNLYNLQALHDEGIHLSLDNFGSGYSSLSLLEKLPIDNLKIDKLLTLPDDRNSKKEQVMSYIVELGKMFHLNLIAEMIEQEEDFQRLCRMGLHNFQGYLFYKPMRLETLLESLD